MEFSLRLIVWLGSVEGEPKPWLNDGRDVVVDKPVAFDAATKRAVSHEQLERGRRDTWGERRIALERNTG